MFRSILTAASITLATVNLWAVQLTPNQALNRALGDTEVRKALAAGGETANPTLAHTVTASNQNTLYIFNSNTKGGFIVVAANDCARPLLGYADAGTFDIDEIPDGLQELLNQYSQEIVAASAESHSTTSATPAENRMEISPLIDTKWYQTAPYNDLCPEIDGKHAPSGCVATAMGQVMNYYQYPERGIGSIAYKSKAVTDSIKVNFAESTYDWENMPKSAAYLTPESRAAVALLLRDCGAACKSVYNTTMTSSNFQFAGLALINNFGYDKGLRILYHKCYTEEEWTDIIYNELAEARPVLYAATSSTTGSGHAFVCDGYASGNFFHINWGWGGYSDGFYQLTALAPTSQGTGGTGAAYDSEQHVLIGIRPALEVEKAALTYELKGNMTVAKTQYNRNSSTMVNITTPIYNRSFVKNKVTFGVKLTGVDGSESYLPSTKEREPLFGSYYSSMEIPSHLFPEDGVYTITMAVRNPEGEWETDCFGTPLTYNNSMTLIANDNILDFAAGTASNVTVSDLEVVVPIINDQESEIAANLSITTGSFSDEIHPVVFSNNIEMASGTTIDVNLDSTMPQEISIKGTFDAPLRNGNYYLALVGSNGQLIGKGVEIGINNDSRNVDFNAAIKNVAASENNLTISATGSMIEITSDVEIHTVAIYNMNGAQAVNIRVAANSASIDTSSLAKGIYVAHITMSDGRTVVKKFIQR